MKNPKWKKQPKTGVGTRPLGGGPNDSSVVPLNEDELDAYRFGWPRLPNASAVGGVASPGRPKREALSELPE